MRSWVPDFRECVRAFPLGPLSLRIRFSNQTLGDPAKKARAPEKSEVIRTSILEALYVFARELL